MSLPNVPSIPESGDPGLKPLPSHEETSSPVKDAAEQPRLETIVIHLPKVTPWVTYTLMGVTVAVFILQTLTEYFLGIDLPAAFGMKYNEAIRAGEVWRLISPVFLHGSFLHIGFNMYALYVLGPGLERHYGHRRFLLLYLVGGFCGNVASFLFSPNPSLGASTAMFAMVAAQAVFIFRNRFMFGANFRTMLVNIVGVIVINLILGLSPGIDNLGHLGGLLGGLAFSWFAGPQMVVTRSEAGFQLADQVRQGRAWLVALVEVAVVSIAAFLLQ